MYSHDRVWVVHSLLVGRTQVVLLLQCYISSARQPLLVTLASAYYSDHLPGNQLTATVSGYSRPRVGRREMQSLAAGHGPRPSIERGTIALLSPVRATSRIREQLQTDKVWTAIQSLIGACCCKEACGGMFAACSMSVNLLNLILGMVVHAPHSKSPHD